MARLGHASAPSTPLVDPSVESQSSPRAEESKVVRFGAPTSRPGQARPIQSGGRAQRTITLRGGRCHSWLPRGQPEKHRRRRVARAARRPRESSIRRLGASRQSLLKCDRQLYDERFVATGSQAAACPLRCPDCRDRPRQTVADPWQAKPRSLRALVGAKAAGGTCLWGPFHPFPPPNHSLTRPAHPPFRPHAAPPLDSISLCWISLVTMPGRAGVGPPGPMLAWGDVPRSFFRFLSGRFLVLVEPRLTHQVPFAWARRQRPTIASWCRSRLLLLDACSSVLLSLQLPWALSVTQYSILRTPCRCHHGHSVVVCRLICPLAAEPSQCRPGHEGARRRQPAGSAAWPNATRRDRLPPSLAGHHCTRTL